MASNCKRSKDHAASRNGKAFLERIPAPVYQELVGLLKNDCGFVNGRRAHLAEYFLGIHQSLADKLLVFIQHALEKARLRQFPAVDIPKGFTPVNEQLVPLEQKNGCSFAYFDAAITEQGIRIIEFQAFPTYSAVAARMNAFLYEQLSLPDTLLFPNAQHAELADFRALLRKIICDDAESGVVIVDRNLSGQKTNFSFYATQQAVGGQADVLDAAHIIADDGKLFYAVNGQKQQVRRLYNRIVPTEAAIKDQYPDNQNGLGFRFDQAYQDMIFVNHPCKYFEISKALLPYIADPINPSCYELAESAEQFFAGAVDCAAFVWKEKWGYAGHANVLAPNLHILEQLAQTDALASYIAQEKVSFELFRTGDGLEKIVELRFMTVQSEDRLLVTPMARIGCMQRNQQGEPVYKVHFADTNRPGYGFCPVLIFE